MRVLFLLAMTCALVAAGCGSTTHTVTPTAPRKLPHALAERLAEESEAVAAAIDGGDYCRAQQVGVALRARATAAIGHVPPRYRESLSSGVNAVVAQIPPCVHASPAHAANGDENEDESGPKKDREKKAKGRGKAKGHR